MKQYLFFIIISVTNLFVQEKEVQKIDLSNINLCKLTLSELKSQYSDLKEMNLIEMSLCKDGFVTDARFQNRKGYQTEKIPGVIFQKERDTQLISKIRLTKAFKGNLPDGNYINVSSLSANTVLKKYPKLNPWISRGCSDYWSLTDKELYFYVAINKNKIPRYPIDKEYYLSKPIEGIDIVANCNTYSKRNEIEKEPLIILNGKEVLKSEIEKYNPENIESITVLKDSSAIKLYGEKGKNGVLIIKTKD